MIAIGCSVEDVFQRYLNASTLGVGKWHRGKANMVFCDGHVELARQTNWIGATEQMRKRWNHDNEPHPETWR